MYVKIFEVPYLSAGGSYWSYISSPPEFDRHHNDMKTAILVPIFRRERNLTSTTKGQYHSPVFAQKSYNIATSGPLRGSMW